MGDTSYAGYQRLRVLGRGQHGCAVLLRNPTTRELVVAKEITLVANTGSDPLLLQNEVRILQALKHRRIVAYIGSFVQSNVLTIVMEYASGGTLADVLAANTASGIHFPTRTVVRWVTELTSAVQHVHSRRILHRDIKTANIFLTADAAPHVKLGDFGVSRAFSTETHLAETMCGTPYYLSPELVRGLPYAEPSDVWALGVIFFELLALDRPFTAPNGALGALVLSITTGNSNLAALRACPHSWWLTLLVDQARLLHPDPARRMTLEGLRRAFCTLHRAAASIQRKHRRTVAQQIAELRELHTRYSLESDVSAERRPAASEFRVSLGSDDDGVLMLHERHGVRLVSRDGLATTVPLGLAEPDAFSEGSAAGAPQGGVAPPGSPFVVSSAFPVPRSSKPPPVMQQAPQQARQALSAAPVASVPVAVPPVARRSLSERTRRSSDLSRSSGGSSGQAEGAPVTRSVSEGGIGLAPLPSSSDQQAGDTRSSSRSSGRKTDGRPPRIVTGIIESMWRGRRSQSLDTDSARDSTRSRADSAARDSSARYSSVSACSSAADGQSPVRSSLRREPLAPPAPPGPSAPSAPSMPPPVSSAPRSARHSAAPIFTVQEMAPLFSLSPRSEQALPHFSARSPLSNKTAPSFSPPPARPATPALALPPRRGSAPPGVAADQPEREEEVDSARQGRRVRRTLTSPMRFTVQQAGDDTPTRMQRDAADVL